MESSEAADFEEGPIGEASGSTPSVPAGSPIVVIEYRDQGLTHRLMPAALVLLAAIAISSFQRKTPIRLIPNRTLSAAATPVPAPDPARIETVAAELSDSKTGKPASDRSPQVDPPRASFDLLRVQPLRRSRVDPGRPGEPRDVSRDRRRKRRKRSSRKRNPNRPRKSPPPPPPRRRRTIFATRSNARRGNGTPRIGGSRTSSRGPRR